MDRALREHGRSGARHRSRQAVGGGAAPGRRHGASKPPPTATADGRDTGKKAAAATPRAADRGGHRGRARHDAGHGGVLSGLIQPAARRHPGRVHGARDRVPPGGQPAQPAGRSPASSPAAWCSAGRAAPTSVGVRVVPLPLCAGRPADHHRQQSRGRAGPARPAHQRADRHLPARPRRRAASSATRPAATSATTWRSCSTAGCRAARR